MLKKGQKPKNLEWLINNAKTNNPFKGKHHTKKVRKHLSINAKNNSKMKETQFKKGHIVSQATREKIRKANLGRKIIRAKNAEFRDRHAGGEYKIWRTAVFTRDNWTCQTCNIRSSAGARTYIEAHHLKSWARYSKLRYIVDNGITLCRECHRLANNEQRKNEHKIAKT